MARTTILAFDREALRRRREARGLSRRALSVLCPNVSESAVQAYEDGRHKPDVDRALELASALRCTVEKLSTRPPEGATHAPHPNGRQDA